AGPFIPLAPVQQARGKVVVAWAFEGDFEPAKLHSNVFSLEWPPRSGKMQEFPEADRGAWFSLTSAAAKIVAAQQPLLDELATKV
ncbi:MAG: NUDIX hydrolase, partial [Candidatus Eremiobacteraeota bacterium]|nr:NUDIX hydrolase [Candidatus Eremiobacteraeota bacterium]